MPKAIPVKPTPASLVYLTTDRLKMHPRNLRRFYPEAQAREMADSIRAAGGVVQPLRIVPDGAAGQYYVVDGNMRLAGARLLGRDCPPLKCEIVDASAAQQLLDMLVTAKFRYDPDPISEALHYRRLIEEERYTAAEISRLTGVAPGTIKSRLQLLDLDPPIQELVGQGRLPGDARVSAALLAIPDPRARVKLAERLAGEGVSIRAIVAACDRLVESFRERAAQSTGAPALALMRKGSRTPPPAPEIPAPWAAVRKAAAAMCQVCEVRLSSLQAAGEPAWAMLAHAAESTCGHCNVRQVAGACKECPGVELLRILVHSVEEPTHAGR